MARYSHYRNDPYSPRSWHEREWHRAHGYRSPGEPHGRYQTGADWDLYETGREQRYSPQWQGQRAARDPGYDGDRSYPGGGYAEEFGHRREAGRGGDAYGEFERLGWGEDARGEEYYGTGTHYGGGFGTAPSARASGAGLYGAPGYAGEGAWSDRYGDWLPESGGGRGTSGSYESYGRAPYGAQSGYGRDYGQSYATRDLARNYAYGAQQPPQREQRQAPQSFRGRGPKGYQRSDERLKEMICQQLTDDPRIDASDISLDVSQQRVRLSGSVEDRRTKYAVEELVERCGASDVDNQLRVQAQR